MDAIDRKHRIEAADSAATAGLWMGPVVLVGLVLIHWWFGAQLRYSFWFFGIVICTHTMSLLLLLVALWRGRGVLPPWSSLVLALWWSALALALFIVTK